MNLNQIYLNFLLVLILINYSESQQQTTTISYYTSSNTTLLAKKYCLMPTCRKYQSISCLYTSNPNMKCSGQVLKLNRRDILNRHNELRNFIASGGLQSEYKSATRMAEMRWNSELELMASFNVKRCIFGHDECRNTNTFRISGQNLAIRQQQGIRNWNVNQEIVKSVDDWFNEYRITDMNVINKFYDTGKNIGHFTVMVKDTNTHVGCAAVRYQSGPWDTVLFGCNYADTNVIDQPIYQSGATASQCKQRSSKYKGLCAKI